MNNLSKYITEKLKLNKDVKVSDGDYIPEDIKKFLNNFLNSLDYIDFGYYDFTIMYNPSWYSLSTDFKSKMPSITKQQWNQLQDDVAKLTYNGEKLFTGQVSVFAAANLIEFYLDKNVKIKDI